MFSFNVLHSQQPQTVAFALADSLVGLLAWNAQLFGESLDPDFHPVQCGHLLVHGYGRVGDPF
jgi:hypothetical protein